MNRFQEIISQEKIKEAEENLGDSKTSKNNKTNKSSRNSETSKDTTSGDKKRKLASQDDNDPEETLDFTKDYVKYFPKYLTSHALFNKEVRCHIVNPISNFGNDEINFFNRFYRSLIEISGGQFSCRYS